MIDRHSQSSAGAAQSGFSARDFVDTVPFIPDDGEATASTMPSEMEASSLFLNDLAEAAPGALARRSPDDAMTPSTADRRAPAPLRPGDKTPAGDTVSPAARPASIAIVRSDAAGHPKPTAPARPKAPQTAVHPGPLSRRPDAAAPMMRRPATPAQGLLATTSRRTWILVALTAAASVVLLVRAATRADQAPPEAATSHEAEPPHTGSATAARPDIDAPPVVRSMPDAPTADPLQAPAPRSDRANDRALETSPGPREDRPGSSRSSTPAAQRRPDATREAVAASVAAAQSKADAFLRSESPLPGKPSSGPGTP